jgi:hypothetical protein
MKHACVRESSLINNYQKCFAISDIWKGCFLGFRHQWLQITNAVGRFLQSGYYRLFGVARPATAMYRKPFRPLLAASSPDNTVNAVYFAFRLFLRLQISSGCHNRRQSLAIG